MIHEVTMPLCDFGSSFRSRVVGYETNAEGEVVEVFTEYGSVPPTPELLRAFRAEALAAAEPRVRPAWVSTLAVAFVAYVVPIVTVAVAVAVTR